MKKIFMASLVAMMAVTAANADIASTSYVQARTGEMTIGADGKVTDANYAAQGQTLKIVAETDALNAAIGKLDDKAQLVDNIHTDANVVLSGDALNTKYPSVGYVDTKIQGVSSDFSNVNTVLGEISGDNGISVGIETNTDGSVKSIALTGSYDDELSAESENAVQNKVVKAALDDKVDKAQGTGAAQKLMNTDDKGNVVAAGIVDDAGNATGANYVTGLAVNTKGELVVSKGKIDVGGDIDAAIAALDATVDATANQVVTGVVETDGKVTAVKSTSIKTEHIENETILSEDIKNGEVKTDDIANLAVTTPKIADEAVTTGKIAAKAVTAAKLADEINTSLGNANSAVQRSQVGMDVNFAISEACKVKDVVCSLTIKGTGTGAVAQWEVVKY